MLADALNREIQPARLPLRLNFWPRTHHFERGAIWLPFSSVKTDAYKVHVLVRILFAQPRNPVSGLIFPCWREPPISPQVRPVRLGLWPTISGISVLWGRV